MAQVKLLSVWIFSMILVASVAGHQLNRRISWPYPPLNELSVSEHYAEDLGALLVGAHRVAADIAYVQFLQYYGVDEGPHLILLKPGGKFFNDEAAGNYPKLKEKAERILRLDPYFNKAILETAGALAFNQKRIDEALALLNEAITRDPSFYRYHLYVAAILYKNQGQDQKFIEKLQEAMKYPDCPPMVQLILGNLLKKYGRYKESAEVFLHVYQTAPQDFNREDGLRRLEELAKEHPEAVRNLPLQ